MKPMLVLIIIGVSFSVYLFFMGKSKPDVVVTEKPYESAVAFEGDHQNMLSLKNVVDNFTSERKDGKVYFTFKLHPERSSYANITVNRVSIATLTDKPVPLKKEEGGFVIDKALSAGWYNLYVSVNADNKTVTLKESIHLDKAL